MFNITKEQKDGILIARISGSIDETVNLETAIGAAATPEVHIYCKEIKRINSIGVKGWIKYFQALTQKGTTVKFIECSSAIVEQINLIANFLGGGTVESVLVPFSCNNCKSELVGLFKVADLKRIQLKIPDLKCSKCGGTAVFDDIPEEYFAFIERA